MSFKHLTIKVSGQVQGINFRSETRKEAKNLDISGFAKNESDGSVLIEAEGTEKNLDKLVKWCQRGPLFAKVEKVEIEEKEITGYENFEIKY